MELYFIHHAQYKTTPVGATPGTRKALTSSAELGIERKLMFRVFERTDPGQPAVDIQTATALG
jgi:hypothetical protein